MRCLCQYNAISPYGTGKANKKNPKPSKLYTSQKFTKKKNKKNKTRKAQKGKGRTLYCNTYKEKDARMQGRGIPEKLAH